MNIKDIFCNSFSRMKCLLKEYNPFDINDLVQDIKNDTNSIMRKLDEESVKFTNLEKELEKAKYERRRFKDMIKAIGNTIPDMMWFKDTDGKYVYVNDAIRRELFYNLDTTDIIGKTDVELAVVFRRKVGSENHTFGEVCGNSDAVVLENLHKQRFLEYGLINGELLYLEVYKAPMYDGLELVGTVGTGRDVTDIYTNLMQVLENESCPEVCRICKDSVLKVVEKYKFTGES